MPALVLVVFMVMMTLVGMLLMELAVACIMSMDPYVIVVPMAREPDELIAIVPITPTFVEAPITNLDVERDRVGGSGNHTSRQKSNCKNRKFSFHNYKLIVSKVLAGRLIRN